MPEHTPLPGEGREGEKNIPAGLKPQTGPQGCKGVMAYALAPHSPRARLLFQARPAVSSGQVRDAGDGLCGGVRTGCVQAAWPARRSGGADGACARQAALCARRVANHAPKGAVAVDSRRSAQLPWRLTDGIAGAKQSKKCNLYLEIFRAWKPAHGHPSSFYRDTHPDRVQASRG